MSMDSVQRFNFVPNDCLLHVFSYLDKKNLALAAKVCKRWGTVSSSNFLWKRIINQHLSPKLQDLSHTLFKDSLRASYQRIVDLVLQRRDLTIEWSSAGTARVFSEQLIEMLVSPDKSLSEKVKAIKTHLDAPRLLKDPLWTLWTLSENIRLIQREMSPILLNILHGKIALNKTEISLLSFLLSVGADPNVMYEYERMRDFYPTPLFFAALANSQEAYDLLISYGADPDIRNKEGKKAADIKKTFGSIDMSKLF